MSFGVPVRNGLGVGLLASTSLATRNKVFTPASLFAAGEQGYWLDPSDFSTMFQDAAGATPVTATGQSVRLMLDKSKGLALGSERVSNGDFSSGTDWTLDAGASIGSGLLTFASVSSTFGANQTLASSFSNGQFAQVTLKVDSITAGQFRVRLNGGTYYLVPTSPGTYTFYVQAGSGSNQLQIHATGTTSGTIDNISVRELAGNHFTQANVANAPILGVEPFGGRRNLLTFTEQFDNAAWSKQSGATATARSITFAADTISRIVLNVIAPATTPASFTATVYFSTADVGKTVTLGIWTSTLNGVSSGRSANLTIPANGIVTHTWTSGLAGLSVFGILTDTAGGAKTVTLADNVGAQLEVGTAATAYQRVTDQWNVTQAGVADCYYLAFDGTDDWLQSAATINPGAVDKAQVFAGVRKLSDAAEGMLLETSTTLSSGSLRMYAPRSAANNYAWRTGGSAQSEALAGGYPAPITNVLTGIGDIAADTSILRANGTQVASSTADQGTGNFLTYTHYIGRRGGTTLPLNGRVYQMVMRFGPNLTAGQITQTENYVAGETGVYTLEQLNRFATLDASGVSYNAYGAADANSNNYLVPKTVLAADGTPYSVL